jgi:PAS domain S-box-containing protein
VLVVDDERSALLALEKLLSGDGIVVSTASTGPEALAQASCELPDVVLTDLHMWPMDGLELCTRLHAIDRDLPVIVMTAHADVHSVTRSLRERAADFLTKPLQYDAVLWSLQRAVAQRVAKADHEALQRELNERLVLSSIREQEHAEAEALRRAQLDALLGNLSEGVLVADSRGRILISNEAARAIMGLRDPPRTASEMRDSAVLHDVDDEPLPRDRRPLERALRGETFADYEVVSVRSNGARRHVATTGTCMRDVEGDVALAIVIYRDVTALRRLEQQRDEYLALISHDLRGPLATVRMSLDLLRASMADDSDPEALLAARLSLLERSERNIHRMSAMLDELREATSLEAHGVELERAPCDLRRLVEDVVENLDDARARRIAIEASDAEGYHVLADARRLERVIVNLVTNALKYSPDDAPVTLHLRLETSSVELAVIDRGIGIAAEAMKRLFDRFYRTAAAKSRTSGLGLGLYIARLIAELHDGRVDVTSKVGEGSTFKLTLPSLEIGVDGATRE